jgi:hypothetical protein
LALLKVFLQELQLEVSALATVQFPWDLKVALEVSHQNISHHRCLLIRDGINLWPFSEVVHSSGEVISLHMSRKGPAMSVVILSNCALTL